MKFTKLLEDIYSSQYKIKKVHSQNPTTGEWEWHDRKVRTGRINFKNSKMAGEPAQKDDKNMKEEVQIDEAGYGRNKGYAHGFASPHAPSLGGRREREDDEGWDREPKQADHPHAVHINGKKWKSFGSQSHAQNVAKKIKDATVHKEETMTIDEQINEVLSKDSTAGDWIHDFVHSDNPKFADKSKDKRKEMALAAYYAKQRNEEVELEEAKDEKEYGYEGDMALNQLATLTRCAEMIKEMLKPDTDMPEWVQSKITLATDYIQTAADYMYSEMNEEVKDEYARKVDKHLKNKYAPVAPVPDKKFIKGTPENLALKASRKPINGHPTNIKEGTMKSFREVIQSIQEANHHELEEGTFKYHMNKAIASDAKGDTKKTAYHLSNATTAKHAMKVADYNDSGNKKLMDTHRKMIMKEEAELDEANHREFAQQGKMHHDMAKHMNPGNEMDFYHPETGDKISGVVKHNSGKEVHIKANKDGKLGAGDVHKFTVTNKLDEALKGSQHKLDKNKNGKVDAHDFKILRGEQEVNKEEVETRTVSFSDFITQLNEYTPGKDGVTRIQGRSYGAQYRDPEGADDAEDKKKQVAKPEPEVKRGRGRPAGSKSGANQKVTSGTKRSGVDYSGYKLHLPNSNR